jgi:hypothetical protein
MSGRAAEVEPYLRGCAWPAADWAAYPRCNPGPLGARLPADTRAQAALPVGVRLEFDGDAEAIEIDYCTATAEPSERIAVTTGRMPSGSTTMPRAGPAPAASRTLAEPSAAGASLTSRVPRNSAKVVPAPGPRGPSSAVAVQ